MLKIDGHTDYLTGLFPFESCLKEGERDKIMDAAAQDLYGDGGFWMMPLGHLFALIEGDVTPMIKDEGTTVFDVYRLKGVEVFLEQFIASLDALTLPPTPDEMRWQQGTKKTTTERAIRVFVRDYFGLHDFKSVDDLTVTDLLIAKEAAYNHNVVERNIANPMKGNRK